MCEDLMPAPYTTGSRALLSYVVRLLGLRCNFTTSLTKSIRKRLILQREGGVISWSSRVRDAVSLNIFLFFLSASAYFHLSSIELDAASTATDPPNHLTNHSQPILVLQPIALVCDS